MAGVMNLTGYIVVGHHHAQADVFTVISLHIVGMYALVLVIGALVDRAGRRPTLLWGLAIMAVSTVMLAFAESIAWMSVSLFLLGLGWNLSYISATAELVTYATPVERGRLVGFTDLVAGLTGRRACSSRRPRVLGVGCRRDRSRRDARGRRSGARDPHAARADRSAGAGRIERAPRGRPLAAFAYVGGIRPCGRRCFRWRCPDRSCCRR